MLQPGFANMQRAVTMGAAKGRALADRIPSRVKALAGPAATIGIVLLVLRVLATIDLHQVASAVPATPLFWLAFAAYFLAVPAAEWVKFRRLWAIPNAGASAILGKLVCNELLFGYSGDAYFFTWVRRNLAHVREPLSTIKDLALVSSLVGSGATLAALLLATPFMAAMPKGQLYPLLFGAACALVSGGTILFFGRRLIRLTRDTFRFMLIVDMARTAAQVVCMFAMWHFAMPNVELDTLVGLSALRMAISRLPLIPNKDMMFLGVAVALLGSAGTLVATMAMVAGVIVLGHLTVAVAIGSTAATSAVSRYARENTLAMLPGRAVAA